MARERYRLGLASTVDVTTATTTLLTVEVRLSEAQYAVQASNVALASRRGRLPLRRRELDLAQPDALRRHLDALVLADQLEGLLE